MDDLFSKLIPFILEPDFTGPLGFVRGILIIISILMVGSLVFFLFATSWLRQRYFQNLVEFSRYRPYLIGNVLKNWKKIQERLKTEQEPEWKLAVIEADNLLDKVLQKMGYGGESLDDRLKSLTSATLPNIDQLFEAHKVCRSINLDPDYRLTKEEAERLTAVYESSLQKLEAF